MFSRIAFLKFSGLAGSTSVTSMPSLGKGVHEGAVRAAVERRQLDEVVARARDVEDRVNDRGLAAGERERADAAFEPRDPLLEHVARRVHDARVDVAELLQREEPSGVVGVVERVRGRLEDGNRARLRSGVSGMAAVNGRGVEAVGLVWHVILLAGV